MRRLIAIGLTATILIPALVWAGGAGNPAVTVGKDNYGVTLEAEEQVASPELVDEGLEALANKHGWAKVIDAVSRLSKKA